MDSGSPTSPLIVETYFASQDARFLEALRACSAIKQLATFAERWKKDPRPWAREQLFNYLDLPLDCAGHQALVKRLFKHAEAQRDDELMAAFMTAFDRLVRRRRGKRWRWDPEARQAAFDEVLEVPRDVIPLEQKFMINPPKPNPFGYARRRPRNGKLFSYATRGYLRRRAWRYFRRMGFQRPNDYPAAVARALVRYRDADLLQGENILDSWALVRVCFGKHPALAQGNRHTNLADGRSLNELSAAPRFEKLWKKSESGTSLLRVLIDARCQLVRVWAVQLLKRDHPDALANLSADDLLKLLNHDNAAAQEMAAELLSNVKDVARWPVATWLSLLTTRSPIALQSVCDAMIKHVTPDRIDLAQGVSVACAAPSSVAKLGLSFVKAKAISHSGDRETLSRLAGMQAESVAGDAAAWALSIVGSQEHYNADHVSRFFDSILASTRAAALAWLTPQTKGYSDTVLWSRLIETPYDDVRHRLVEELDKRSRLPGKSRSDLAPLWTSVLLNVHRGGRQKLRALRQVSDAVAAQPETSKALLPVLAVAMRSLRPTEARAGLAAVVAAATTAPDLAQAVAAYFPELSISPEGATR